MRGEQSLDGLHAALRSARIVEKVPIMVRGEYDPEQFERKLPGIGIGGQFAGLDGKAHRLRDRAAQFLLAGEKRVVDQARLVVRKIRANQTSCGTACESGRDPGERPRRDGRLCL